GTNELFSPITKADNPGWTGSKLYADNGAVKVGSGSANGSLTSPTLDLRLQQGIYTVVFFAKGHSASEGKNLQVVSSTEDGSVTRDFTLTNEYARYETTLANGAASTTLSFMQKANAKGRFYIDSVLVYQPAQPSLDVKPLSNIIYKEGSTGHDTLSVRGALLTQDVTVSCTNDRFEFSPALLDAEAVMSAEGVKIFLTYTGTQEKDTAILRLVSGKVRDSVRVYAERFVKKIPVQYHKPTVKPNEGVYDDSVRVSITSSVKGATIRYTLDGTLPNEESTLYTDTFTLYESAVLKAAVFQPDTLVTETSVTKATFTIRHLTPAPLPFDFTGVKSDINISDGIKQEGLGSDYAAPCRLRFDNTGDYLLLVIADAPDSLYFDIKGNGTSGNYVFKVETSTDASAWTELKTYAGSGLKDGVVTEEAMPLNAEVRYIRWTYETKDKGNVGLGNIHVTKPITDPTLWLSPRMAVIPAALEGTDTASVRVTGAVLHQNLNVRLARNDRNAFRLVETMLDKDLVMNRRVGVNLHVVYSAQNAKGVDT
ncbi:MAG: chitobiase/beta-hexosaminidase C-terminal domain-containing protein, partial [Bacteroidales bacterium]|nr:chitobiase/beta-hexosaminidase C-terminal domain-containing protein [Bacteroidales bacterium]